VHVLTRRMGMITAVTRLLLDNGTFSEAVTLQRCARLLAGDIASWVIVDVERGGSLRRQFVIGPHDEASEELARKVRAVDPPPGSTPTQVHTTGQSMVLAHADDSGVLGATPDGTPLLMLLGATSLLSVPISDSDTGYGVLTLARRAAEGRFEIGELGLTEELGGHLGVAIRVDRMFRVLAHWNPDPVDVLAKANEVILAGDYEDRFVTAKLAYLRWDGARVRVELASSGHPGPAVVRPDGRVDVLSGGGLPLGLFPDAEPERDQIELGPGRPALLRLRWGHRGPAARICSTSRTDWPTSWPPWPAVPPPRRSDWFRAW
jgi:hypothetical protein